MAKELLKTASAAAIEKTLQTFLPDIIKRLDLVQQQVTELRRDVDFRLTELRKEVDTKFERTQELINELGLRINTIGTRLETYAELLRHDTNKGRWLPRTPRSSRRGSEDSQTSSWLG